MRLRSALLGAAAAFAAATPGFAQQQGFAIPAWAFPSLKAELPSSVHASDTAARTLAHSKRSFTGRQLTDAVNPPDWHPESHPPAPDIVIHARPEMKYACGLCHLPDGQGRSENATIAGLPVDYVRRQIGDFRSGARAPAADFASSALMKAVALAATDSEIAQAARYFSALRPRRQYTVVEATSIPRAYQAGGLYARRPGAEFEPLGDRMMEISDNIEHHELRGRPREHRRSADRRQVSALSAAAANRVPDESAERRVERADASRHENVVTR